MFDHAYPMHTHDDWAVMLVDDGAVSYDLGRGVHYATPSALTLLPPDVPHDGRSAVDGELYKKRVLYLEHDWLPDRAQGLAADSPTLTSPGPITAARHVHEALEHPGDLMAAEYWLLIVRDHILARGGTLDAPTRDVPLARTLRALIDDRLTESFTIAAAATELGAHPSHLVRVFSQTYGIAPHQYQISRRVDLARRLLVDGHRPAEASVMAGFHDQAHLTRHFRRVLGTTPGAFAA